VRVTVEPRPQIVENPFGLSSDQEEYRAARVVASASTDATDCAMLLAVLGLRAVRLAIDDHAV
jgi:hypothetical protein